MATPRLAPATDEKTPGRGVQSSRSPDGAPSVGLSEIRDTCREQFVIERQDISSLLTVRRQAPGASVRPPTADANLESIRNEWHDQSGADPFRGFAPE